MSIEMDCHIEGVEEFREAMERFDSAMQRSVRSQLERWACNVKALARQLVPVRTGYLRSTIYARIQEWVAEIGAEAPYAVFVEFGTRYVRAKPFIYPAVREHLSRLERIICDALETAKGEAGLS